jgi:hypothetical protein
MSLNLSILQCGYTSLVTHANDFYDTSLITHANDFYNTSLITHANDFYHQGSEKLVPSINVPIAMDTVEK